MIIFPHAKINLGINVLEKMADGFHNIESIFYPVFLSDILEIIESYSKSKKVELFITGLIPEGTMEENLVYKATMKVAERYDIPSVKVHLHKIIPSGAGLGGGSSDCAYTIMILNKLFNLKMGSDEMIEMAGELGSDCSYFIEGGVKLVKGTGKIIEPFNLSLTKYFIVIVIPDVHVSTSDAYSNIVPGSPKEDLVQVLSKHENDWNGHLVNDFEKIIFRMHPKIEEIKANLYKNGAVYASMSGTGSAVYAIFSSEPKLDFDTNGCFVWKGKM